jgi:ApeA N-terminal domain 1
MTQVEIRTGESIQRRRVLRGRWWLPADPTNRCGGTLEFAVGEGGLLELQGGLMTAGIHPLAQVIFGLADGEKVTICDGLVTSQNTRGLPPAEQIDRESWQCSTVFVGIHADEGRATLFDNFNLETARLPGWVDQPRPNVTPTGEKVTIESEIPPPHHSDIDGVGRLTFWWSYEAKTSRDVSVVIRPTVEFQPNERVTIDRAWRSFVTPMLFFMTFVTGTADRIVSIRANRNQVEGRRREVVQVLMPWWAEELSGSDRSNVRQNLVQFAELRECLEEVLSAWFHLVDQSSHSIFDFFAVAMTPSMYAEESFLRVARSIESWHRSAIGGTYMSDEDFGKLLDKLTAVMDNDERAFVKPRLRNERTLRQRLDELLEVCGEPVGSLLAEYQGFSKRVVNTRNSLAHEGQLGDAFTYAELFWAQKSLEHVFRSVLLRRLGFADEQIIQQVCRTAEWRWMTDPQNRLLHWREYQTSTE